MKPKLWLFALALTSLLFVFTTAGIAADVKTMTKEELNKILDQDSVTVLDVRTGRDWSSSEFKIKGADRVDPKKFADQTGNYPKANTLVLYCA